MPNRSTTGAPSSAFVSSLDAAAAGGARCSRGCAFFVHALTPSSRFGRQWALAQDTRRDSDERATLGGINPESVGTRVDWGGTELRHASTAHPYTFSEGCAVLCKGTP